MPFDGEKMEMGVCLCSCLRFDMAPHIIRATMNGCSLTTMFSLQHCTRSRRLKSRQLLPNYYAVRLHQNDLHFGVLSWLS